MEWHENGIGTDEAEPEVNLSQGFVHHAPKHLGEPEVGSSKNPEHCCDAHHQMEVSDHEVGRMQHDVSRGLCQEEAAHASADEHRNKSQTKKRSRVNSQLRPVEAAQPDQHKNRGG